MQGAILQFAGALITDAPKLTMGSKRRALVAMVALALPLIAYFGWLYYREWKMKRDFRRYWEGKARRSVD